VAEGLTKRVGRIISGSINAIINAVEDSAPEMVMEQAIREIDSAIDEVRAELGRAIAAKHLANKRLSEKNSKHEELSEKIEFAVTQGRDDLAEAAIANQLDIEAQIPVLEHTIAECGDNEKELEGFITALQAKKREMKEELSAFRQSMSSASADAVSADASKGQSKVHEKIDQATSAFDRVLEKQTGVAGMHSSDTQDAAKMAELEKLSREHRIRERLAVIKSSKGK